MKSFRILVLFILISIISSFVFINTSLNSLLNAEHGRPYRVEASRIEQQIINNEPYSLNDFQYITDIEILSDNNTDTFYSGNSDYLIKDINNHIYRFDYSYSPDNNGLLLKINLIMSLVSLLVIILLIFIYYRIIKPFNRLKEMPFDLSKGILTTPLKENKQDYFGKFIWGMDLLREKLEQQKTNELALQKEKKTLVLSLSHDIKTPLGVIDLYAKALEKGLYNSQEKKTEVAQKISEKCKEIKNYVDEIIKASNEDFLKLEVNNSEFYLLELINATNRFYKEKLELMKINFKIDSFRDVLIKGDLDRAIEVIQNIIENAIKYGDGKMISISFSYEDNCSVISISNSGSTLSENELTHIFDSFWRGSNTGSNSGSGLGLYICRQLMFKMGGDIFAKLDDDIMTVSLVFGIC